jgi:hypothetical protein
LIGFCVSALVVTPLLPPRPLPCCIATCSVASPASASPFCCPADAPRDPLRSLMPLPHAACLPRCPHGRRLLAAATTPDCLGRPLLRCPHLRCLVADGASSAAHHQTMYTCPAARPCPPGGRDCAARARDPLPRKACAAICTETVQGTPWHRSRYPKQTVASNFQGTPNLYVDGTSCFLQMEWVQRRGT